MRVLREPLVHFLVLGVLVYVAANRGESARYEIDAGPEQRARLARTYYEQYGAPPTAAQLGLAVDEYVRNEILYREGLAMGLERDDEIVRRRVVQKIEFVNEDLDAVSEPDGSGIEQYFAQHRDRYDTEPAVSFEQLFFSTDRGGDAIARRRAEAALAEQSRPGAQAHVAGNAVGPVVARGADAFAEGQEFRALTRTGANSVFGDTNLSAELFTSPTGQWVGPFKSAYGWHIVRITDRQPTRHAELAEVRSRVHADYIADLRARANAEAFSKIAAKYRVITNTPSSATAAASGTMASGPSTAAAANGGIESGPSTTAAANGGIESGPSTTAAANGGIESGPSTTAAANGTVRAVLRAAGVTPSAGPPRLAAAAVVAPPVVATGRPRS
jgi:hypothetical protein